MLSVLCHMNPLIDTLMPFNTKRCAVVALHDDDDDWPSICWSAGGDVSRGGYRDLLLGEHVPELVGEHVPELVGEHVPQLVGEHVPELGTLMLVLLLLLLCSVNIAVDIFAVGVASGEVHAVVADVVWYPLALQR
jgi:hypothetical protein